MHTIEDAMEIEFRPALAEDFEYCRSLYLTEMEWIIEKLHLDKSAHEASFRRDWTPGQVRIIRHGGCDVGWLQSVVRSDGFFLAQLFVEGCHQRRGVGARVMNLLIREAAQRNQPLLLEVVKINPARRLYERLGFQTTHEDDRKYYMKLTPHLSTHP